MKLMKYAYDTCVPHPSTPSFYYSSKVCLWHSKPTSLCLAQSNIISCHASPVVILTSVSIAWRKSVKFACTFKADYSRTDENINTPSTAYKKINKINSIPTFASYGSAEMNV